MGQYHKIQSATHFQPNFATTIHKAQGSEWNKIVVILQGKNSVGTGKNKFLNNNLLYTAITRAKKDVEIYCWGSVCIEDLMQKQKNEDKYNIGNI